jgi:acyl-coenzyme A synthetase/AMP-(fatty) acid ligase
LLHAGLSAETFSSARLCVSAGERLPAELCTAWRQRFGVEILDGIGATETIFMVLSNRPGRSRPGSSGEPVPGTEARILDAEGRPVPDGQEGVLWVRTPSQAAGYWQRLDHSRRTFVGDWFRTGDVYRREADGGLVHCGREDEFFNVAGLPGTRRRWGA